jgi:hypothetical protein
MSRLAAFLAISMFYLEASLRDTGIFIHTSKLFCKSYTASITLHFGRRYA